MSIEIFFHPAQGTKTELTKFLKDLSFKPSENLRIWPKGSLHFHWFEIKDYRSYDGVEATIARPSADFQEKIGKCTWYIHTRTRMSASPDDRAHQNRTIREARLLFGGSFYNDWYGINRYTPIRSDGRDAIARGLYLTRSHVRDNISKLIFSLPDRQFHINEPKTAKQKQLTEWMGAMDPSRILYNALVPFAVASLEYFFSRTFQILLQHDSSAKKKLEQQTRKIELSDLLAVRDGKKSVEDVVASWYSFQNLSAIHNTFKEWFAIDFWKVIRQNKTIGKDVVFLETKLIEIIEFRHGIIHQYHIDTGLDRDQIKRVLEIADNVIEAFVTHLEDSRGVPIREQYELLDNVDDPNLATTDDDPSQE